MNLLLEWQMQNDLGIDEALDQQIDEGISSGESEKEDPSSSLFMLDATL
jgi:hypothetical protein